MNRNDLRKPRPQPKKKRVTLIVGIILRERIVLACDSQTTSGTFMRTDTSKIVELRFDEKPVLVAQSGDATLSGAVIEFMQREMDGQSFDDWRKPADIGQDAVRLMKEQLRRLNNWDDPRLDHYLNENPASLMLAYFHNGQPYLYVINAVPGYATRQKHFSAIGCGANVGGFILSRALYPGMGHIEALAAAIYTVEEVKKVDAFCGGPTRAAMLGAERVMFSEAETELMIECVAEVIQKSEPMLKEKWSSLFKEIWQEQRALYSKKQAALPPKPEAPPPDES